MSSHRPKHRMIATPTRRLASAGGSGVAQISGGNNAAMIIARPPRRDIGASCTLRSPGKSRSRNAFAARTSGGINTMQTKVATTKLKKRMTAIGGRLHRALIGNVVSQAVGDSGGELRKLRVRLVGVAVRVDARDQSHQCAVGPIARERIPQQIPLHRVFVGKYSSALLEPVIN